MTLPDCDNAISSQRTATYLQEANVGAAVLFHTRIAAEHLHGSVDTMASLCEPLEKSDIPFDRVAGEALLGTSIQASDRANPALPGADCRAAFRAIQRTSGMEVFSRP